jgi:uncharacterized protein (DUF2267 family)
MELSIENQVLEKIKNARRGTLFFGQDFVAQGSDEAVRKALERLVKKGEIERIATGIYLRPEIDPIVGKVPPSIESIVKAIAKRDKARIVPTGITAMHQLGLSTQVPMTFVYLTDGSARNIQIDGRSIVLKRTSPKNVATVGKISTLVIQALRMIGKDNVSHQEVEKIRSLLKQEKKAHLEHDIRLAPAWIRAIMTPTLQL